MDDPDNNLRFSNLNLNGPSADNQVWISPFYPPILVSIDGENILTKEYGGSLLRALKTHAPNWYEVASDAFVALYTWHGTTDVRPMKKKLANIFLRDSMDSLKITDPNKILEIGISFNIGTESYTTSKRTDSHFMERLNLDISYAQDAFYERTVEAVRYLVLPSYIEPWQHPGIIPSDKPTSGVQVDYVVSLVTWSPITGYNLWHEFLPNDRGGTEVCWFERHSLKSIIESIHFEPGSPGYLFIQQQYTNPYTGGDDWGPLSAVTFHSTTWVLAAIHVYLWADVLGNNKYSTDHFTNNRRDAIIEHQQKIQIMLRKILRKRVPGLDPEQNDFAYNALHRFMGTNPKLPFLL